MISTLQTKSLDTRQWSTLPKLTQLARGTSGVRAQAPRLPLPGLPHLGCERGPQAPVCREVSSLFSSLPLHLLFLLPGCPPGSRPAKMLLPPESLPGLPPCLHRFSRTLRGPSPSASSQSRPVSPPDVSSLSSGTTVDEFLHPWAQEVFVE